MVFVKENGSRVSEFKTRFVNNQGKERNMFAISSLCYLLYRLRDCDGRSFKEDIPYTVTDTVVKLSDLSVDRPTSGTQLHQCMRLMYADLITAK